MLERGRGDVLIRAPIRAALAASLLAALVAAAPAAAAERVPVLIRFDERPTARDISAVERAGGRVEHRYSIVPAVAATLPERAVAVVEANPRVAAVEPDQVVSALDYRSTHDWGIGHIRADAVHATNTGTDLATGLPVTVAVIDSGIDCGHAELPATRCAYGYDYVNGDAIADDDWGHGTHVGGTVAANRDLTADGQPVETGVVGAAPSASLLAYKILDDQGYGSISDVIASVDHVWNGGTPKAAVVNMSLGWSSGSTTFQQSMDRAYGDGVLLVAAAGNGGNCGGSGNSVSYPARYSSVVAVAAVDQANQRPCWSSTGDQVELAAPGVSVFSTWPSDLSTSYRDPQPVCDGGVCHFKYGSGTSMSAPHVAGAAALVLASGTLADGNANGLADEARQRLAATAVDIGKAGRDRHYGHGLIDALAATAAPAPAPDPGTTTITLTARGYKKGTYKVDLSWSGATSPDVDVRRNGAVIATTPNDGAHTDSLGKTGGSYTYEVCEAATTTCSDPVTVTLG